MVLTEVLAGFLVVALFDVVEFLGAAFPPDLAVPFSVVVVCALVCFGTDFVPIVLPFETVLGVDFIFGVV